ncbi:nuclear transport factor 2-like [Salvia splendens]|uniref:nuclear transport factor 2-like n=1 Tax=Salvia splendens TaxID=180675 RepID=UPI001C276ED7|nr:nuclear transport factor 2-like [Salvia splendens]
MAAAAAEVAAQQPVTAQIVGSAFVMQYYHILHQTPEHVYRFYQDISKLGRPQEDGTMTITTTMQAINEKILALKSLDFVAEVKSVDSQESFSGGVHVLVTGYLMGKDKSCRSFAQSFFLAPQDNGYFVLNDMLRYLDSAPANPAVLDGTVPVPAAPATIVDNHVPDSGDSQRLSEDTAPPAEEVVAGEVYNPLENGDVPILEEEVPVAEVVDEVENGEQMIVQSSAKIEELPKKSYASIVMHLKESAASSPPLQVAPRKAPPKIVEPMHPSSSPVTNGPISGSEAVDNGNNAEGEADGYSIYIKGLPMNATESLLEEVFKKFGTIKSDGIQVRSNRQQAFCFGFVEFEDASSVQKALEASPVTIGARQAFVEEKRSTNTRNSKGRFQPGRGSGFRYEGVRGRGNYGGGRGYGRGDFNGRGEFGGRGGRSSNRDGYQRSENMSSNGGGRMNRTGGLTNGNTKSMAPRVSATA